MDFVVILLTLTREVTRLLSSADKIVGSRPPTLAQALFASNQFCKQKYLRRLRRSSTTFE
jgi:hypothetical protein